MLSVVFRAASVADAIASGPAEINASNTLVKDDAFSRTIEFDGAISRNDPLFGDSIDFNLRSWMDRSTHAVKHQLYVDIYYQGGARRHYEFCGGQYGRRAQHVVQIDHSQTRCKDCQRNETVGITLSAAKLVGGLTQPYPGQAHGQVWRRGGS